MRAYPAAVVFGFLGFFLAAVSPASAQSRFDLLLDLDSNPGTGCLVTTSEGSFDGVEWVVSTSVDTGAATVSGVSRRECDGAALGAPITLSPGGWPVGIGNGDNGADVIETQFGLGSGEFRTVRLALISAGGRGDDALSNASGTVGSTTGITLAAGAIGIPTLSILGLGVLLLLIAVVVVPRLRQANSPMFVAFTVSLVMLGAGLAWAAALLDGNTSDWNASQRLAQDVQADGEPDIVSLYGQVTGSDTLVFRFDAFLQTRPQAVDDSYSVAEDSVLTVAAASGVLANDTSPFGAPLSANLGADVSNGNLTLNADGSFTYTPNTDFNGVDTFSYIANDGTLNAFSATVTISVGAGNDAPVFTSTAVTTATQDSAYSYAVVVTDADNDPLSLVASTLPSWLSFVDNGDGTATLSGTPSLSDVGNHPVLLQASDGTTTVDQSFSITVSALNADPVAVGDSYSVDEDGVLNIAAAGVLINDSDADNDPLTAALVTDVSNGTLALNADGSFDYTPNADFNGSDSFTYNVNDGTVDSTPATVVITVNAVNDAPVFTSTALTGAVQDNAYSYAISTNDVDGDTLTITAPTLPSWLSFVDNGDGTASLSGTPVQADAGSHPVSLQVSDGTVSATQDFTIVVDDTNDTPVAVADAYSVDEDTPLNVVAPGVLANDTDADSDPLNATLVTDVSNGSLAFNANGSFDYTPNANYNGSDSFTYRVSDGTADSNTVTVTITVNSVNDAPTFVAGANETVLEDAGPQAVAGWATGISDGDDGSQLLSFNVTNNTNPGLFSAAPAVDAATGNLTYTAASNANGSANITLVLSDNGGTPNGGVDTSAAAVFTITVTAVDDPTIVIDDAATVTEDDSATAVTVLANDSDPDNAFVITGVTQPGNGTVVITGGGTGLTYQPDANYCNDGTPTDNFTYTVTGGATGTVAMTVTCVNDAPTVTNATISYTAIGNTLLRVPGNDADHAGGVPERIASTSDAQDAAAKAVPADVDSAGVGFSAETVATTQGGSLTIDADGDFYYLPPTGFAGADSVAVTVEDTEGLTTPVTINITVSDMIWYVEDTTGAKNPAGGPGTSVDAFETLTAAEAASGPGDTILVFETDGGLDGAITLQAGQKLFGQIVEEAAVSPLPVGLVLEEIADTNGYPVLTASAAGPIVTAADNAQINGLFFSNTPGAGIDVTDVTGVAISNSQFDGMGTAGVAVSSTAGNDVGVSLDNVRTFSSLNMPSSLLINQDSSGAMVISVANSSFLANNNALDAQTTAGLLALDIANTGFQGANGIDLDGSSGGTLAVTGLSDITILGAVAGVGINANTVVFDADPSDTNFTGDTVSGGTFSAGSQNAVASAIVLQGVSGDLAFTSLGINASSLGLSVNGSGSFNAGAGTGFQLATPGGSVVAPTGVVLNNLSSTTTFDSLTANGGAHGLSMNNVAGSVTVSAGTLTDNITASVAISGAAPTLNLAAAINQGANNARAVDIASMTGGSATFSGAIAATDGTGIRIASNTGSPSINFTSTVDLGSSGSRLSDGTALQLTGNSTGTSSSFSNLDVFTSGQTGIRASSGGGLTVTTGTVDAAGAAALDLDTLTSNLTLTNLVSSSSTGVAVDLANVAGSVSISGGSISGSTGIGFNVSGGAATVSYAGGMANTAGRMVNVENKAAGTVTFSGALNDTGGQGIRLNNNTVPVNFTGTVDLVNTTDNAVSIDGGSGTSTFANLDINNNNNQRGILANGSGTLNITTGTISVTGAPAFSASSIALGTSITSLVSLTSSGTGINFDTVTGSAAFPGTVDITNSGSQAIRINNSGTLTATFADLDVDNSISNGAGLFASNAGTLTITTGTINSGSARAVDINDSVLAVNLVSVNSNGGTGPGIDLNTTTGFFTVNGDGSNTTRGGNGSGGTIANKGGGNSTSTGIGVLLNNATNVSLRRMQINDHVNWGLYGTDVNGLVLQYLTINGINGNDAGADEGAVYLADLSGTALAGSNPTQFDNVDIEGGLEDNIRLDLSAGTLADFRLTNSRIGLNSNALGNDGVLISTTSTANGTFIVDNNTFIGARGDMFQLDAVGTSNATLTFSNNAAQNTHGNIVSGGITISGASSGGADPTLNYTISGNVITDAVQNALTVSKSDGAGTFIGTISGNTIGVSGNTTRGSSFGSGMQIVSRGSGRLSANVQNNQVYGYGTDGIAVVGRDGSSQLDVILQGNTIANPAPAFAFYGISAEIGATVGDTVEGCLTIGGAGALENAFTGAGPLDDFILRQRNTGVMNVIGYAGGGTDGPAVLSYVQGQNTGTPTGSVSINTSIGGSCSF
jgi:VCBS repeat-containing protein